MPWFSINGATPNAHTSHLVDFTGGRIATASDIPTDRRLDNNLLKRVSGTELMATREVGEMAGAGETGHRHALHCDETGRSGSDGPDRKPPFMSVSASCPIPNCRRSDRETGTWL